MFSIWFVGFVNVDKIAEQKQKSTLYSVIFRLFFLYELARFLNLLGVSPRPGGLG